MKLGNAVAWIGVICSIALGGWLSAQTVDPTTQPDPDAVRLTFLGDRLSSVEASITAINHALVVAGYQQSVAADHAANYEKGNELMNRNGGGPVAWQDFYGRTAKSFIVRDTVSAVGVGVSDSGMGLAAVNAESGIHPVPRPEQFDYVYQANSDQLAQAQTEVAKLGRQTDVLLARRRQLEAEQSMLWATMAFESIENREIPLRPLYHYQLKVAASVNNDNRPDGPRLDVERAMVLYLRTVDHAVTDLADQLGEDQQSAYRSLRDTLQKAQADMQEATATFADTPGIDGADVRQMNDVVQLVKRIGALCKNTCDAYDLALDGDKQGDEQRKQTFRGQLQESLMAFAETAAQMDEALVKLSARWDIRGQVGQANPDKLPQTVLASTPTPSPEQTVGITPAPQSSALDEVSTRMNQLENWTINVGTWKTTPDGKLEGGDDGSDLTFNEDLPGSLKLSFQLKVITGDRPFLWLNGTGIALEDAGNDTILEIKSGLTIEPVTFAYQLGQDIPCSIQVANGVCVAHIGDKTISGLCKTSTKIQLKIAAGRAAQKSKVDFSQFRLDPVENAGKPQNTENADEAPQSPVAADTLQFSGAADAPINQEPRQIDLLSLVNPSKDAVTGDWIKRDGQLICTKSASHARVQFPYIPPTEYDYRITFTLSSGSGFDLIAASDKRQFVWVAGGWSNTICGFEMVDGKGANANKTTRKSAHWISENQVHESLVKVRRQGVEGYLDGQLVGQLATDYSNISLPPVYALPQNNTLGMYAHDGTVDIQSAQVIEISGPGTAAR